MEFITVSQLNEVISKIFRAEEMLHDIIVMGEVSGLAVKGGHAYFTLKDDKAQLHCCCFNYSKTHLPKNGEAVLVKGTPDYWATGGRLSFNVAKITPYGLGLLFQRIEELKLKLKQEGLFDDKYKKPIPKYADSICVVTSKSGAVIRDIITTVRKKNKNIDITLCDVRVQGERAAEEIVVALKNVDRLGYDVIILARGGGSVEDLMPFNSEQLARAIFEMKTPIISAIGHETDYSIADMAADLRAATPTAAAECAAYDEQIIRRQVIAYLNRGKAQLINNFEMKKLRYASAVKSLSLCVEGLFAQKRLKLQNLTADMVNNAQNLLNNKAKRLDIAMIALDKASPLKRLEAGYFKVEKDKKPVSKVAELEKGDKISLYGQDGTVGAEVMSLTNND